MDSLESILGLVGKLDDSPGEDTPRERFRAFLKTSVASVGTVRDFTDACVKNSGAQYARALQDLVNLAGGLIGFDIEYGRYAGTTHEIGHDGLWRRDEFAIVVEVKTTDAYSIKTATLLGYIDKLVSAGALPNRDQAMGLYVFARADAELKELTNSIVAEKVTQQLRIATVDDVLSLAELVQAGRLTTDEAFTLFKPAGVLVSDAVSLLARIAAQSNVGDAEVPGAASIQEKAPPWSPAASALKKSSSVPAKTHGHVLEPTRFFIMTPIRDEPEKNAREAVETFLKAGWYVFGDSTPGRRKIKPGDRICFYETGVGVIGEAEIASYPERKPPSIQGLVINIEKYPWSFKLKNPRLYSDNPVVIDASLRSKLDAFKDKEPSGSWGFFVQSTRLLTEHDFQVVTGQQDSSNSQ